MYLYKIDSTDVKNMPMDSLDEIDLKILHHHFVFFSKR